MNMYYCVVFQCHRDIGNRLKVIYRLMDQNENRLLEFNEIFSIVFVIADLVLVLLCLPRVLGYQGGIRRPKLTHVAMWLFMLCACHNVFIALPN